MMGQTDDILEFYTYIQYTRNTLQLYILITNILTTVEKRHKPRVFIYFRYKVFSILNILFEHSKNILGLWWTWSYGTCTIGAYHY
jgi:hypothetical protein